MRDELIAFLDLILNLLDWYEHYSTLAFFWLLDRLASMQEALT